MATRLGNSLQAGGLSGGGINTGLLSMYAATSGADSDSSDILLAGEIDFIVGTPIFAINYLSI